MKKHKAHHGFTIIELTLSIAILAIIGTLAVPMFGNNDALQLDVAKRLLVSDIEYAQILAITNPNDQIVLQFEENGTSWHIASSEEVTTPLLDSVTGDPLSTSMGLGSAASSPDTIVSCNNLDNALVFNSNGGLNDFSQNAEVTLDCGESSIQIIVSATTGTIR